MYRPISIYAIQTIPDSILIQSDCPFKFSHGSLHGMMSYHHLITTIICKIPGPIVLPPYAHVINDKIHPM